MSTRPQDISQRDAIEKMRVLLRDFVAARIDVATFNKAFAFCFAPFDPLDYDSLDPGIDASELATYIRISGGWFSEDADLIPFREDWTYGVDTEPYGWIDVPAFRAWIVTQAFDYLPDLNGERPDAGGSDAGTSLATERTSSMIDWHAKVAAIIEKVGHQVVYVACDNSPSFGYSVGLFKTYGFELVFAGGGGLSARDVGALINAVAKQAPTLAVDRASPVTTALGEFTLRPVAPEWASSMLLQAVEFWGVPKVPALQIVPPIARRTVAGSDEVGTVLTVDIPDMTAPWDEASQPVWRGFFGRPFPTIPLDFSVVTNLQALQGEMLSEGARWEVNQWEIFAGAGPDVAPEDVRIVPFATLLAIDPTIEELLHLDVGKASKRDELGPWEPWLPAAACEVPTSPTCT